MTRLTENYLKIIRGSPKERIQPNPTVGPTITKSFNRAFHAPFKYNQTFKDRKTYDLFLIISWKEEIKTNKEKKQLRGNISGR